MFISFFGPFWYFYALDLATYIIIIPAIIFALWAQIKVKSTYNKFSRVYSKKGLTGAEAARIILSSASVKGVNVVPVKGNLSDHYNPKTHTLCLSEGVFSSSSVAALGIAAHEAGHAIQHANGYFPLKLRSAIVPVTRFGSIIAFPLAILGVIIEWAGSTGDFGALLIAIGIVCYSLSALFSLITLPVEFNASRRAKKMLLQTNALDKEEVKSASKVLSSAAMTYVASLAVSIVYLLRFILIISTMRRRR